MATTVLAILTTSGCADVRVDGVDAFGPVASMTSVRTRLGYRRLSAWIWSSVPDYCSELREAAAEPEEIDEVSSTFATEGRARTSWPSRFLPTPTPARRT